MTTGRPSAGARTGPRDRILPSPAQRVDATTTAPPANAQLAAWAEDARARSLALIDDLDDTQLIGPRLPTVNPLLWEIGHVAWFQERFALRQGDERCRHPQGDSLWDSISIPHVVRWDLPLPSRADTLGYVREVFEAVQQLLAGPELPRERSHRVLLAVLHEDMHGEAFAITRQALGYPGPQLAGSEGATPPAGERVQGDVDVPGGCFVLGVDEGSPRFAFDNERWAHEVEVAPFSIARTTVTEGAYRDFVDDGGYARDELWSADGRAWRDTCGADGPLDWRRTAAGSWERRVFDAWTPVGGDRPMMHVNAHEAEAWCRWARRRLPTEIEWEVAASGGPCAAEDRRRHPWGGARAHAQSAVTDGWCGGPASVHACAAGDGVLGVRQMLGNVWEWTSTAFAPYPGFRPGPYPDYSRPLFGITRVLRGGCWATRARLLHNGYRNYYGPDRRDVFAGFRTCALP